MNKKLEDIYKDLEYIMNNRNRRNQNIKDFQLLIFGELCGPYNDEIDERLSELAFDLDYYEDDKEIIKESFSYYGEDRLYKEINDALSVIRKYIQPQKQENWKP